MTADNNRMILDMIEARFPGKVLEHDMPYGFLSLVIDHDSIVDIITNLKDEPSLRFGFLTTCCGLHFPDAKQKFGMMYQLHSLENNYRIRLKAFTNYDPPVFPTLTGMFKAANWMEREAYDFYGFRFTGHPDLRRILNMDSLEGWPLRKEYPLEDPFRRDKDDKMFGR
ncbi:MAG: NADH-quinone oxidoreductase subunit C [Bacteroidota bacterium]